MRRNHGSGGNQLHVVVTGGAGFIGSNVSVSFLRDGHRVTVFDGLQRRGSERNLAWLQSQPQAAQLRFVQGDVRDLDLVRSIVGTDDVHLVFHFAAQTAVTTSLVDPREDLDVNIVGTHNVLEAIRLSRAPRPRHGRAISLSIRTWPSTASARPNRSTSTRRTAAPRAPPINTCATMHAFTAYGRSSSVCRASTDRANSATRTRVGLP